jgi:hypothetical protein
MLRIRLGRLLKQDVDGERMTLVVGPPPDGQALHFRPGQFLTDNAGGFIVQLMKDRTVMVTDEATPRDIAEQAGQPLRRPFPRSA